MDAPGEGWEQRSIGVSPWKVTAWSGVCFWVTGDPNSAVHAPLLITGLSES